MADTIESVLPAVSASSADRIKPAGKFPKRLQSFVNGTSKFSGARQVVGETGKEVLLRRTLAYGTKYDIGAFSLTDSGEQQIGLVPDKTVRFWMPLEKCALCQTSEPKLTVQLPKQWETSLPRSSFL